MTKISRNDISLKKIILFLLLMLITGYILLLLVGIAIFFVLLFFALLDLGSETFFYAVHHPEEAIFYLFVDVFDRILIVTLAFLAGLVIILGKKFSKSIINAGGNLKKSLKEKKSNQVDSTTNLSIFLSQAPISSVAVFPGLISDKRIKTIGQADILVSMYKKDRNDPYFVTISELNKITGKIYSIQTISKTVKKFIERGLVDVRLFVGKHFQEIDNRITYEYCLTEQGKHLASEIIRKMMDNIESIG